MDGENSIVDGVDDGEYFIEFEREALQESENNASLGQSLEGILFIYKCVSLL